MSEYDPNQYNLCLKLVNGMKTRKIMRLKELNLQKQQILDLQRTVQDWVEHPDGYKDLISKSLKDLRRKKVKFFNTHQKYFSSSDWSWLLHTKARETNPNKQFKPVYQQSSKMNRLNTTDDEDSFENTSFYRPLTVTYRGSEPGLDSDRSSKSSPLEKTTNHSRYSRSLAPQSNEKPKFNAFRVSEDNPLADNITKYYKGNIVEIIKVNIVIKANITPLKNNRNPKREG